MEDHLLLILVAEQVVVEHQQLEQILHLLQLLEDREEQVQMYHHYLQHQYLIQEFMQVVVEVVEVQVELVEQVVELQEQTIVILILI